MIEIKLTLPSLFHSLYPYSTNSLGGKEEGEYQIFLPPVSEIIKLNIYIIHVYIVVYPKQ
jgi:hypothetical protein